MELIRPSNYKMGAISRGIFIMVMTNCIQNVFRFQYDINGDEILFVMTFLCFKVLNLLQIDDCLRISYVI